MKENAPVGRPSRSVNTRCPRACRRRSVSWWGSPRRAVWRSPQHPRRSLRSCLPEHHPRTAVTKFYSGRDILVIAAPPTKKDRLGLSCTARRLRDFKGTGLDADVNAWLFPLREVDRRPREQGHDHQTVCCPQETGVDPGLRGFKKFPPVFIPREGHQSVTRARNVIVLERKVRFLHESDPR